MNDLRKQVRRARRRLVLEQFGAHLRSCLFFLLIVAAVAIGVNKLWPIPGVDDRQWTIAWLSGAVGLGVLSALAWTIFKARSSLEAAIELDRRFGLRERVSSALALRPEELETPVGQALMADTLRKVSVLDVSEQFRVRPSRRALLPLWPAAAAFLLGFFVGQRGIESEVAATNATAAEVKKSAEELQKKLAETRKEAAAKGLEEMEGELKKIEEGTKKLAKKDGADRKKALVDLNELAKQLEERREKLGGGEKLKEQLSQLKGLEQDTGDRLAESLRSGDFKKALDEIEKLKEQLAKGNLNEQQKAEVAKKLANVEKKLQEMAAKHEQAKAQLAEQIKQMQKAGQLAQANKLQAQLDKMLAQEGGLKKMQQMAAKMGQCAQCLQQGQGQKAQEALAGLAKELAQLDKQMNELAMLDQALQQMMDAKNAMACMKCNGAGCQACQTGNMKADGAAMQGKGIGHGRGGIGPKQDPINGNAHDSQVRANPTQGPQVFTGEAEGPNLKGQVFETIRSEFSAAHGDSADPLTNQRLPRNRREHAQSYFDTFREGR
ncbi:MAG: hypothetical protein U0836_24900 [Pirellulales bacterium]